VVGIVNIGDPLIILGMIAIFICVAAYSYADRGKGDWE
jgi:hypothetical protein